MKPFVLPIGLLVPLLVSCAQPNGLPTATPDSVVAAVTGYPGAEDVPVGEIRLHFLRPGLWSHVSTESIGGTLYASNGLIVRDGDGLLLVDTPWGEEATVALLQTIDSEIGLPVRRAVVTHFHDDRIAGSAVLEEHGVQVFASPLTRRLAAAEGNAVPSDSLVSLGAPGDTEAIGSVEILYPGGGHSRDNLVVYIPDARVLVGGCAIFEAARQTAGNVADADLDSWPETIRRIQAHYPEVELVLPGHGVPGGPELLEHTLAVVQAHGASGH